LVAPLFPQQVFVEQALLSQPTTGFDLWGAEPYLSDDQPTKAKKQTLHLEEQALRLYRAKKAFSFLPGKFVHEVPGNQVSFPDGVLVLVF
jgi:hypothetical protein